MLLLQSLASLGLGYAAVASAQAQMPLDMSGMSSNFNIPANVAPSIGGTNFTTLSLRSLSTESFTTLSHPYYPSHSIRIKKSPEEWCDPSVSKYTGYIDTSAARHLFFYFFESRSEPDKDDVVMWINGGPGSSSTIGLLMELGRPRTRRRNCLWRFNPS